jgi:serine/threonine protein kinase
MTPEKSPQPVAPPSSAAIPLDTAVPGESTPMASAAYLHSGVAQPLAIPGYELFEVLGRGGMGVVHRGRQVLLNRFVAVKFLPNATAAEPGLVKRFMAEAQVVAAIRHPNVIDVYDFGETAGVPFIVMELLEKNHLGDRFPLGTAHDPARVLPVMIKVARGVAGAHEGGIIHRDLKPANVLFDRAGEPKVVDFGLAKRDNSDLTQSTTSMGTPFYMSPEQAKGKSKHVGPSADVWSLGVMLYEQLTGRRPFAAEHQFELLINIVTANPPPLRSANPKLPEALERIVMKCLAKKPTERYTTALELAKALEAFQRGVPGAKPAKPASAAKPIPVAERLVPLVAAPAPAPAPDVEEEIPVVRPRRKRPSILRRLVRLALVALGIFVAGLVALFLIGLFAGKPNPNSGSAATIKK